MAKMAKDPSDSFICYWNGSKTYPKFSKCLLEDTGEEKWTLVQLDIHILENRTPKLKEVRKGIDKNLKKILDTSKLIKNLR